MTQLRSLAAALCAATLLVAALAAPAAAGRPVPPEYGSAVKCKFMVTQSVDGLWAEAELRLVAVIPPVMYATEPGNMVGWRFVLRRSVDGAPYLRIHKSVLQRRIPANSENADFSVQKVRIQLPAASDPESVRYQVTLVMLHYNSDGSVHSKTTYLMTHHLDSFDGVKQNQGLPYCEGTATQ